MKLWTYRINFNGTNPYQLLRLCTLLPWLFTPCPLESVCALISRSRSSFQLLPQVPVLRPLFRAKLHTQGQKHLPVSPLLASLTFDTAAPVIVYIKPLEVSGTHVQRRTESLKTLSSPISPIFVNFSSTVEDNTRACAPLYTSAIRFHVVR